VRTGVDADLGAAEPAVGAVVVGVPAVGTVPVGVAPAPGAATGVAAGTWYLTSMVPALNVPVVPARRSVM
jgi:hypothetical protein